MASDVVRVIDKVCGTDLICTESQVGYSDSTGLLGVIGEVTLSIHIRFVTDDLMADLFAPTVPSEPRPRTCSGSHLHSQ